MDSSAWDERYSGADLVWSAGPNLFVEELLGPAEPGRVLDIACGEGRNSIWLAQQGWQADGVDFSPVAIERARSLAEQAIGPGQTGAVFHVGDATALAVEEAAYDVVLFSYMHLPAPAWRAALEGAVRACRPGGRLIVIGHARRNIAEGYGGPQNPDVLLDPEDVIASADGLPLDFPTAEIRERVVTDDEGVTHTALDTLVVATRA